MKIEKEFIPYEQSLALKELRFEEPCMRGWDKNGKIWYHPDSDIVLDNPTFSQAFRWFRENYDLMFPINKDDIGQYYFSIPNSDRLLDTKCYCYASYEEAEFECLKKLIEIVKNKK